MTKLNANNEFGGFMTDVEISKTHGKRRCMAINTDSYFSLKNIVWYVCTIDSAKFMNNAVFVLVTSDEVTIC